MAACNRSYDRKSKPAGNYPDCIRDLRLWAGFILRIQLSESHDGGHCLRGWNPTNDVRDSRLPSTGVRENARCPWASRVHSQTGFQPPGRPHITSRVSSPRVPRTSVPSPPLSLPRIKAFALCVSAKERVQGSGRGHRHISNEIGIPSCDCIFPLCQQTEQRRDNE